MELVDRYGSMDIGSYVTMPIIVWVGLIADLSWAVGLGILVQIMMVMKLPSKSDPIAYRGGTRSFNSSQIRSAEERRLLV